MTNSKLQELIKDFILSKDDSYKVAYYCSQREYAEEAMNDFVTFLKSNGVKIKLEN